MYLYYIGTYTVILVKCALMMKTDHNICETGRVKKVDLYTYNMLLKYYKKRLTGYSTILITIKKIELND